jgi:hypothetical protein
MGLWRNKKKTLVIGYHEGKNNGFMKGTVEDVVAAYYLFIHLHDHMNSVMEGVFWCCYYCYMLKFYFIIVYLHTIHPVKNSSLVVYTSLTIIIFVLSVVQHEHEQFILHYHQASIDSDCFVPNLLFKFPPYYNEKFSTGKGCIPSHYCISWSCIKHSKAPTWPAVA